MRSGKHALAGNGAGHLVPINADNSISFDKLGAQIDILIDAKVGGIYSNGTAGEFFNQSEHVCSHTGPMTQSASVS